MADNNTIARPYAQAAFDLAREAGTLEQWSGALGAAARVMSDGTAAAFLSTPRLTDAERLKFLTGLFAAADGQSSVLAGGNERGTNFLKLLLENDLVGKAGDEPAGDVDRPVDVLPTPVNIDQA